MLGGSWGEGWRAELEQVRKDFSSDMKLRLTLEPCSLLGLRMPEFTTGHLQRHTQETFKD